ncbi:MAG TPA: hypothetical protein VIO94_15905 [Phenylobacterium sp.]
MLTKDQITRALDLFERFVLAMEDIAEAATVEELEEEAGFGFRPDPYRGDN